MILRNRSVAAPLVAAGPKARGGVRRLAYLLAGTALASVGFAPEAVAACNVTAGGSVNCGANTTTTNTTNLNGAATPSSDRIQEFNNGANVSANIGGGFVVDGFGLNILLSNAGGNNGIAAATGGGALITTNQAVAALQLNGNGGAIIYSGNGSIVNTGSGVGLVVTNTGAGSVNIFAVGGTVIGATTGIGVTTATGSVTVSNLALVQGNNGQGIGAATTGGGIGIIANSQIISTNLFGIAAGSGGGSLSVRLNGVITGSSGMLLSSQGGALEVRDNGNITGTASTALNAFSGNGSLLIQDNGNINGAAQGINADSGGGSLSIQGNGNITGAVLEGIAAVSGGVAGLVISGNGNITGGTDGIVAISGGGGLSISGNGNITGGLNGIFAHSGGGSLSIVTGGAVTGLTATGITTSSGDGTQNLTLNHNVTGATIGVSASATTGSVGITNNATLTGGTNAISGSTTGAFFIGNTGTINGAINVTGSTIAVSQFANSGTWNTGTGNSSFSGGLFNFGTLNAQNGVGQQTITFANGYTGGGAIRVDLSDRLNLGPDANLTGSTLNVAMAPNSPLAHSTVVVTTTGAGLLGTTFASTTLNIPNVQTATVVYTATDVLVNITGAQLGNGSGLNQNQQSVANGINNFFNAGGNLPGGFGGLFALTGPALGNALTQISGENASGLQPAANLSMGMFLNAMLDPFAAGRNGGVGAGAPLGYAPETPSRVAVAARDAFAADMPVKAPYVPVVQRWNIWGAAYGGRQRTDGDPIVGSNDLSATVAGFAAGADYRVSRDTVVGMAATVGQSHWRVSGLGNGGTDFGQVGGYASTRWDNLYLSGAAALGWHRASTSRMVTVAGTDFLEAEFDAISFGGRLEGGYRFGGPQYGLTPYAAVQVQSLRTPGYSETATVGSNQFALTFASQTTTDTRSELGFWADARVASAYGIQTTLRGRVAWVHDYNPGSRINPAFQTLPGASFTIDGAAAPRDAALTSAVAEFRLPSGVRLIGKVDGEFSSGSHTIAGTATAKYAW